jgi:fermentation-respiration switch protein FrsA (DUF1100 family)
VLGEAALIEVPAMIQAGEKDSLVPFARLQDVYDLLRSPRFLVEILNTGHFAFANACLSPSGTSYPDCAAGTIPQDDANALVLRFAVPFLGRYVAGDPGWTARLEAGSEPPGVVYVADP